MHNCEMSWTRPFLFPAIECCVQRQSKHSRSSHPCTNFSTSTYNINLKIYIYIYMSMKYVFCFYIFLYMLLIVHCLFVFSLPKTLNIPALVKANVRLADQLTEVEIGLWEAPFSGFWVKEFHVFDLKTKPMIVVLLPLEGLKLCINLILLIYIVYVVCVYALVLRVPQRAVLWFVSPFAGCQANAKLREELVEAQNLLADSIQSKNCANIRHIWWNMWSFDMQDYGRTSLDTSKQLLICPCWRFRQSGHVFCDLYKVSWLLAISWNQNLIRISKPIIKRLYYSLQHLGDEFVRTSPCSKCFRWRWNCSPCVRGGVYTKKSWRQVLLGRQSGFRFGLSARWKSRRRRDLFVFRQQNLTTKSISQKVCLSLVLHLGEIVVYGCLWQT